MNKTKKSLKLFMSFVLALSFLVAPFSWSPKNQTASSEPSSDIQIIDNNMLNYVTISTDGQSLSAESIKTIDTNSDGKADTSYVFTNRSATLIFEPFTYGYEASFDSSNFYQPTYLDVEITKLESEPNFPANFEVNDNSYTYSISGDNKITITAPNNTSSFTESAFVSMLPDTSTTRTFRFITSYTLKSDAPNSAFSFIPFNSRANATKATQYTVNFERPIVNFKNDDVTLFTCKGLDIGNTPFTSAKIERELSYENVKFQITNNDYTENNPLYFDINHDGFIYTFKLFSKTYGSDELLFVEYYDEQKSKNKESLATVLDEEGNVKTIVDVSPVYKYDGATTNFNMFSIEFENPGRYEIFVYDETYRLKLKDNNFYSTSFYIKTNDSLTSHTAFENAYAIMQKYDDEGNLSDYIVSGSTQNSDVKVTLKNLDFYFEHDAVINSFTPTDAMPELNIIEIIETVYTGGLNEPVSTFYNIDEIKEMLSQSPDLVFECQKDAFYQIFIYQYEFKNGSYVKKPVNYYQQFTISKQPKIQFTYYIVDENNDRIQKPNSNQFETDVDKGDTPFTTVPKNYKINIDSKMNIVRYFSSSTPSKKTYPLNKTYLNEFTINYAMQSVKIEQIDIIDPDSDKVLKVLGVKFLGVGEIKVDVTVNSLTKTYTIQSGEILQFEDYGTYSFSIQDSMGTVGATVIKYTKPVSTSAILLIALVGVIVLAIVLFVISSRGKLKTR